MCQAVNKHVLTTPQRLKSALWYSIGQFVDEKSLENDLNATPQFIGALTELVYTQIGKIDPPLDMSFSPKMLTLPSKHSPRSRGLLQARRSQHN